MALNSIDVVGPLVLRCRADSNTVGYPMQPFLADELDTTVEARKYGYSKQRHLSDAFGILPSKVC